MKKPRTNQYQPPSDLHRTGRDLWQTILHEYEIDDSGSLALLVEACRAADRAEQCAKVIERDGPLITSANGNIKDHPLLKVELLQRSFVTRTLIRLGVVDPPKNPVGRPVRGGLGVTDAYRINGREDA